MPFRYLSDRLEQQEGAIAQILAEESNGENPFHMPQIISLSHYL